MAAGLSIEYNHVKTLACMWKMYGVDRYLLLSERE
jgi:hypothetical protein